MTTYTVETNENMEKILDEITKRISKEQPNINVLKKDVVQSLFISSLIDFIPLVKEGKKDVVE